ncbi:MAG: ACT domain-containing protein [Acidobacteriia bacterium]|nr:ACT domain-containing protein [Terriglobia bacterium]
MAKVKQLTVALENQPGALAQVAQVLADAKVNIVALLGSTAGTQGSAQVVVDNVNKAKKALKQAGTSYTEGTLEQFELNNKPGALAEATGKLAKKGINIDFAYATAPKGARKAMLVVSVSQPGA